MDGKPESRLFARCKELTDLIRKELLTNWFDEGSYVCNAV